MISEWYTNLKKGHGECTFAGILKRQKGSKWVQKYVELHHLLLALYKSKEDTVNGDVPPEVIHFGIYDSVGERPDHKGSKFCLVLSSTRDHELEELVLALDNEEELQQWKEKILGEIVKGQGPLPKGHLFIDNLVSCKGKCDFCNQSLKKGYQCSVCNMKVHRNCKVHCNFLSCCLVWLSSNPLDKNRDFKETLGSKLSILMEELSERSQSVDLHKVWLFEYFVNLVHENFPPAAMTMKEKPESDLYNYECFNNKRVSDAAHCYHSSLVSQSDGREQLVIDYLVKKIIEGANEREQECAARILVGLASAITGANQLLSYNRIQYLIQYLEQHMQKLKNPQTESYALPMCIVRVAHYCFLVKLPEEKTFLSLLFSLVKAQEIKYVESKKKGNDLATKQRVWIAECADMLAKGAPILYNAYKMKESYALSICKHKGLSVIVSAAEQNDFSIHSEVPPNQLVIEKDPIYTGMNQSVKVLKGVWKQNSTDEGMTVAIKQFKLESDVAPDWWMKEVTLQSLVVHPLTCQFIGANPEQGYMITRFYANGSLDDVIYHLDKEAEQLEAKRKGGKRMESIDKDRISLPKLDTCLIVNICIQACNAIAFLHSKGIMHRDIKPGNILLDEHYTAVVCDFGASRVAPSDIEARTTCVGTTPYMAPELLADVSSSHEMKADTYSMALVLWQMLTHKEPYASINKYIYEKVPAGYRETYFPPDTHPDLKVLIEEMWTPDPRNRPSFDEVLVRLYNFKDKNGCRYCERYLLPTSSMWRKSIAPYFEDQKDLLALALTCKHFQRIFKKLLEKVSKYVKNRTIRGKANFALTTTLTIGNTNRRIDYYLSEWELFILPTDGSPKALEPIIKQVTYTLEDSFAPHTVVVIDKEPYSLKRVTYHMPVVVRVEIDFCPSGSATLIQHVQQFSETSSERYVITSDLLNKTVEIRFEKQKRVASVLPLVLSRGRKKGK